MAETAQKNHRPLLIFVRGIPGSGKSFFTEALRDALVCYPVTVVDPDQIDIADESYINFSKKLEDSGLDSAIHPFRWLRQQAIDAAHEDAVIIWNQPFTKRDIFDRLVQFLEAAIAEKHRTTLQTLVIEISTPMEVAWGRILSRKQAGGHGPNREIFEQRVSEYSSYNDSYDTIELDGETPVATLIAEVQAKIQSLR